MPKFSLTAGGIAAAILLAGCAQQEEPVMVQQPMTTPIYAKDGTIIGERPVVTPMAPESDAEFNMGEPPRGAGTDGQGLADDNFVSANATASGSAGTGGDSDDDSDN